MSTEAPAVLEIDCEACGAQLHVPVDQRTTECPYCGSPSIVERPPSVDRPTPTFTLPFVLDREHAVARVKRWMKSRGVFAHRGLAQAALEKGRGVYVPAWLYGAVAHSTYSADIGENYTEIQTYTTTDSKGNTVTRTRTVTKTEWRHLDGVHASQVLDILVTASRGIPNTVLEKVEPFDLRAMRRYNAVVLAGWHAEEPSLGRSECLELAREEATQSVGRQLRSFLPGDSQRNLEYRCQLDDEVVERVDLPVWSFAVRYDSERPPLRVTVNGQSGEVVGSVPKSPLKIAAAVLLGALLVGLLVIAVLSASGGPR